MNIEKTMQNLQKNGIEVCIVETKKDAVAKLSQFLHNGDTVSIGGSMSLSECGVIDFLKSGPYVFSNQNETTLSGDERAKIYEKAYTADVYICSSNAVTENGELYNVDGRSNRISAIAYGPKSVVMIVGINKIVTTLDEAVKRVKTIAAPKNCIRLHSNTYCKEKGMCKSLIDAGTDYAAHMSEGCSSSDRICCQYLISTKQRVSGRIKVIFVNESIGY